MTQILSGGRRRRRGERAFSATSSPYTEYSHNADARYPSPAAAVGSIELNALRGLSRNESRSHPIMKAYRQLMRRGVVGSKGPQLKCLHPQYADLIQEQWHLWTTDKMAFDKQGFHTLKRLCGALVNQRCIDGEGINLLHGTGKWGVQCEHIDPGRIPIWSGGDLSIGHVMGIWVDKFGKPTAYEISMQPLQTSAWNQAYWPSSGLLHKYPAKRVLHFVEFDEVDAYRGWPPATNCLEDLNLVRRFSRAALANANLASAQVGAFKRSETIPSSDINDADDTGYGDAYNLLDPSEIGILDLPPGVEYQNITGDFPDAAFGPFLKTHLELIASSLGVSPHHLVGDYGGINYSAGMLSEQRTRDTIEDWQACLEDTFLRPLFRKWLGMQVARGMFPSDVDFEMLAEHKWRHRGWMTADPKATNTATMIALRNGLTSRTHAIEEMGGDAEDIAMQRKADDVLFGDKIPGGPGMGGGNPQQQADNPNPKTDKDSDKDSDDDDNEDSD